MWIQKDFVSLSLTKLLNYKVIKLFERNFENAIQEISVTLSGLTIT